MDDPIAAEEDEDQEEVNSTNVNIPWYMVNDEGKFMVFWQFVFASLVFFNFIYAPLITGFAFLRRGYKQLR